MARKGKHWEFIQQAIQAFESDFGRELNLDEKVALAANTRREVRKHFRTETGKRATF
jgi:transcriptional regulator GlxA family with amidase domain